MGRSVTWVWNVVVGCLVASFCFWVYWVVSRHLAEQWEWGKLWKYREILWRGLVMTAVASGVAMVGSVVVGGFLLAGLRSGLVVVRVFCRFLLEVVRDTPLLVLLLIGYFLVLAPLGSEGLSAWLERFLGEERVAQGWNDKLVIGICLLSCFSGAYLGEILRGGVESIPQGQLAAAHAVGFSRVQTWRHVILPQAMRRVLPAMAGLMVSLIKDSSLLSVIGVQEFAYQAKVYSSKTYGGLEAYVPLAFGYLLLTLPVAGISLWLEKRFRYEM
jgi:polar amino acid transport system permease protein